MTRKLDIEVKIDQVYNLGLETEPMDRQIRLFAVMAFTFIFTDFANNYFSIAEIKSPIAEYRSSLFYAPTAQSAEDETENSLKAVNLEYAT